MKYLIVNGDDFGASRGINRGIFEAHRRGILTSASLLVDAPWGEEAGDLSRAAPRLSVGLHVHLANQEGKPPARDGDECRAELHRQFRRFLQLVGQPPTHLDSHHHVHRDPRLLPHFRDFALEHNLPLRAHTLVRSFTKFYGRWGGESHPEQISAASLTRMLKLELEEGVTELICHPGYVEPGLSSSYTGERRIELDTLCDPLIRRVLTEQSIQLINYRQAYSLPGATLPA